MSTTQNLVQLAVDSYKGVPVGGFSLDQSMTALTQSLIKINNGKNYLDMRDVRDGKCNALFTIIEEIITRTVIDGLQGNEFFMNLVEYKNLALGDKNEFFVPDDATFKVATIASGTQSIRRQRLGGGSRYSVNTRYYAVKIYEHLDRVLSGRVNLNDLIRKVGEAMLKQQYEDIATAWSSIANTTDATYIPVAGSYDEDTLLNLCEHVEVNNNVTPVIMGTLTALRKVKTAVVSDSAKEDMYKMGYYGRFGGAYNMIRIKQQHKTNSDEFMFKDNELYIIGTDIKPIKYVNEGQSLIITGAVDAKADLTQEYFMRNMAGVGIAMPDKKMGIYKMSA